MKKVLTVILIIIFSLSFNLVVFSYGTPLILVKYVDSSIYLTEYFDEGKELEISVSNIDEVCSLFIVSYDINDCLINCIVKENINSDRLEKYLPPNNTDMIKVFIWDNKNNISPKCVGNTLYKSINYEKPIGNGTDESPYKVTSVAELSYLREEPGAAYILANNIDLSDVRWNPFFFCGKLDGLNNSITGIKVADNAHNSGLFSKFENRTRNEGLIDVPLDSYIKNLNVEILDSGSSAVFSGGIAGELGFYMPLIENCSVKGNITARSKQQGVKACAGGIAGISPNTNINMCSSTANIASYGIDRAVSGGIVGEFQENPAIHFYASINNCSASGQIFSKCSNLESGDIVASGGICGYFYGNFNYIENCISNTQLYSDKSAGGIVGEAIDNEAFNRIENCIDNSVVVKY